MNVSQSESRLALARDQARKFDLLALREDTDPRAGVGEVVRGRAVGRSTFGGRAADVGVADRMDDPFDAIVGSVAARAVTTVRVAEDFGRHDARTNAEPERCRADQPCV